MVERRREARKAPGILGVPGAGSLYIATVATADPCGDDRTEGKDDVSEQ